jgi:methionine aminotransferase
MSASGNTVEKPPFPSRLPEVAVTIFTRMSALAKQHDAVNLGQGFPDFDCDPVLVRHVSDAMQEGRNQYPPMSGVPELRQAISTKIEALYGRHYDAQDEITVTAGGTQALFCAIMCAMQPGDEVIVVEPAYDSYIPAILLAGGIVKPVRMRIKPGKDSRYSLPFEELEETITPQTRLLIINTPHNPTGTIWRKDDMLRLQALLKGTNVLLCSDEVYEHIVFNGARHESVACYDELAGRSFVISSFSKPFHVTGWKVGYVAAPRALTEEFRKIHQFNVFSVNAPMQYGIARYLEHEAPYKTLPDFYQKKRDYFRAGLSSTRLRMLPCDGTYFQAADYSELAIPEARLSELEFAEWLTREIKVAAIPMSAFYSQPHNSGIVRFCFAKRESTLSSALERLKAL